MKEFFNLFIMCFFLSGCAAQMHASKGWELLDQGQPDEAIEKFEMSRSKEELPGYYLGMYQAHLLKKDLQGGKRDTILLCKVSSVCRSLSC